MRQVSAALVFAIPSGHRASVLADAMTYAFIGVDSDLYRRLLSADSVEKLP